MFFKTQEDLFVWLKQTPQSENTVWNIFIGEHTQVSLSELINQANEQMVNIVGGIFPSLIHKDKTYEEGILVKKVESPYGSFVVKGLDSLDPIIPTEILTIIQSSDRKVTLQTFVDGLASQVSVYLVKLYELLGNSVHYIGGGAGSLTLKQMPCVFNNEGCFENAAIVLLTEWQSSLGVQHGWERLEGPLIATKTNKNVIEEINWQNAFEVYQSIVNDNSNVAINKDNFFEVAKSYPFGIKNDIGEDIVRDPIIVTEEGGLVCVGEIPENATVNILKGVEDNLISSAGKAVELCKKDDQVPVDNLLVSCISRNLFHDKNFGLELEEIATRLKESAPDLHLEGILTLGEISSYGKGYLKFFNKTVVNCSFYAA